MSPAPVTQTQGAQSEAAEALGPWSPGIESQLPRALMPLSTMFRPAYVSTTLESALELSDATGLPPHKLVAFRPERLVIHELLIRVTADLSVPAGDVTADLGINFRRMTEKLLQVAIAPHMGEVRAVHEAVLREAEVIISAETGDVPAAQPQGCPNGGTRVPGLMSRLSRALGLVLRPRRDSRPLPPGSSRSSGSRIGAAGRRRRRPGSSARSSTPCIGR